MKRTWIIIILAVALGSPFGAFANHDKNCKATHGTVSAKTDFSITVNGTTYTVDSGTKIAKESGDTASLTAVNTGDKVCVETTPSEAKHASKVTILDHNTHVAAGSSDRTYSADSGDRTYAREKLTEGERKAHEAICQGHHGTISDKTANTLTIDGKTYAFNISTPVNKQEEPLLPKTVKVGDGVCYVTEKAADGSMQISKLIALDRDTDSKVRVREKESDSSVEVKTSPDKVEVETPNKKIEVK